jgi:hypothetical protein
MYGPPQLALEAARRILYAGNRENRPAVNSRLLADLAEMIRQRLAGEKLLEESSHWPVSPMRGRDSRALTAYRH